jgi:hypothetical protein
MAAAGAVKDALATGGVDKVIITFFKNKLNFLIGPKQTYVLYARFFMDTHQSSHWFFDQ